MDRFNSRFWNPGTEAIDAFTVNWSGENNYWCPPVHLIPRVLHHARACGCHGTIVVPEWTSAVFWPLVHDAHNFRPFVVGVTCLPCGIDLLVTGKRGSSLFKDNVPNTNMLALRVEFAHGSASTCSYTC